ncbi:hypothetical protein GGU10DRAFT_275427 [Lentinula aff. detonsa]|uniref:Uncharacterized protein n=1 Tax=Lentinula aff. detonsa TaxID=2804958 RepID=A0AA38NKG6_9AGAR|nr:hypothetical protein GGU10DRAFT_275427 [Lentinula aff. detonsa]
MKHEGLQACFRATKLKKDLKECILLLKNISLSETHLQIHSTLCSVEARVLADREEAQCITRLEATAILEDAAAMVQELESSLKNWRSLYPNDSPIQIDNASAFVDPNKTYLIPTLMAYSLVLSQRIFSGASELSTNATLQVMRLYGSAVAALGGKATLLQQRALEAIPSQVETVENQFNLRIETTTYAVCPNCNFLYEPRHSSTPEIAAYPDTCTNRSPPDSLCNTPLLNGLGKPLKGYEYYPFPQWFSQFVAQPGIQQYAKSFCDEVCNRSEPPADKMSTWDGDIYQILLGPDGKLFVDGGDEGRFFFLLHVDFFSSEGTTGRGKHRSTGIASLKCLNLPFHLRDNISNVYIPGFWQGPKEPSSPDAQLAHLLEPLILDLEKAYTRGIRCLGSSPSDTPGISGEPTTFRCMLAGSCSDLKAARPHAGLLDVNSHHSCFTCNNFHQEGILRTDFENWLCVDDGFLREGMQKWREAQTMRDRETIEHYYGTRCTALEILPYFKFSIQIIADPMHAFYHRIIHLFIRNALGLTTLSPTTSPLHTSDVAFLHEFSPPPPQDREAAMKELASEMTYQSAIRVGHVHRFLRQPLGDQEKLEKNLETATLDALKYVCLDINRIPIKPASGSTTKAMLMEQLVHWRLDKPVAPLTWPVICSGDVLAQVHRCIRDVVVPSWISKPPFDCCLKSGGTLKADNWHLLSCLYLPLALLSLWIKDSPLRANDFTEMEDLFLQHYKAHIEGLKRVFPGFGVPSHHVGFHVYDFMRLFSAVQNFWCFSGERLIGKFQKTLTNHKPGQFEITLLHTYGKGVGAHRWLMRLDCSPLLTQCHDILNKAYHFSTRNEYGLPKLTPVSRTHKLPHDLAQKLSIDDHRHVKCYTRIETQSRSFTVMGVPGPGNSYVCFHLDQETEWKVGQIKYIFKREDGPIQCAIRQNLDYRPERKSWHDPFKSWWSGGFEAKTISKSFSGDLTIMNWQCVLGHAARWDLTGGISIAVNLSQVGTSNLIPFVMLTKFFTAFRSRF